MKGCCYGSVTSLKLTKRIMTSWKTPKKPKKVPILSLHINLEVENLKRIDEAFPKRETIKFDWVVHQLIYCRDTVYGLNPFYTRILKKTISDGKDIDRSESDLSDIRIDSTLNNSDSHLENEVIPALPAIIRTWIQFGLSTSWNVSTRFVPDFIKSRVESVLFGT